MKTLKSLSLLASSALVATAVFTASCSNDVEEPQVTSASVNQPISFYVQGGIKKLPSTTLDYMQAFVVSGQEVNASDVAVDLMTNATVYRQVSAPIWTYNPIAYYSTGAKSAKFNAYSPVSPNVSSPTLASFTYNVIAPTGSENAQEDLLVATQPVTTPSSAAVTLNFSHALSRVFVSANNATNSDIIIKDIALVNVGSQATYTYGTGWGDATNPTKYSYSLPESGVALPAQTAITRIVNEEQGMMVMPQTTLTADETSDVASLVKAYVDGIGASGTSDDADGNNFYLAIEYKLNNLRNIVYVGAKKDFLFAAGMQYNLIVRFDPDTDGDGDVDGDDGTNPLLPVAITFTPQVSDFGGTTDHNLTPAI